MCHEMSICVATALIWQIKVWRYSFVDHGQYIILLRKKIKHQITYKTNERLERPFLKNCFIIKELSNPARQNSRRKHLSTADGNGYFGTHSFVLINAWMDKSYFHSGVKICLLILNVLFTRTFFKSTPR